MAREFPIIVGGERFIPETGKEVLQSEVRKSLGLQAQSVWVGGRGCVVQGALRGLKAKAGHHLTIHAAPPSLDLVSGFIIIPTLEIKNLRLGEF